MKKLSLIFMIVLFCTGAYAQSKQFESFLSLSSFSATFTQDNHYPGVDNFTTKGVVHVVRPKEAIWIYEEPVEYYHLKPNGIDHFSKELNQLLKIKVDIKNINDPASLVLSLFLDSSNIKSKFTISENGDDVILTPKDLKDLNPIVMTFSKSVITAVSVSDKGGNSIKISFATVKQNQPVDPAVFNIPLPPKVQIIEQ